MPGVDDDESLDHVDSGLAVRRRALEDGSAHANGGGSRVDLIGALIGTPGGEAEDALGDVDARLAVTRRPGRDEMREPDRRARPDRQIGAVGENDLRGAFLSGFHRFVAHHARSGAKSHRAGGDHARDVVFHHGGDADRIARSRFPAQQRRRRCESEEAPRATRPAIEHHHSPLGPFRNSIVPRRRTIKLSRSESKAISIKRRRRAKRAAKRSVARRPALSPRVAGRPPRLQIPVELSGRRRARRDGSCRGAARSSARDRGQTPDFESNAARTPRR